MEERIAELAPSDAVGAPSAVGWRDLREWLALIEANGQLKRIAAAVDPDEELAAITFMATRREDAPALLFEQLAGDRSGASVLANMLGASKERYALAVGLDPDLSIAEMIAADAHDHEPPHRPGADRQSATAPVNEIVLTGRCHRHDGVSGAEILARRRRPLHRHRRHHAHRATRQRTHQRRLLSADAAWTAADRALLLARQARPARPRGLVGTRRAVRGGGGLWHRPGAVHAGGAGLRRQGVRARRRRRDHGTRHRADARRNACACRSRPMPSW